MALRDVVRRVLAAAGYRLLVASDGGEALMLAEEHGDAIDLVLTDVVMPGISGPRLVERLKPLCPNAKVIFMSGYTDDAIAHHDLDPRRFLNKPFDWTKLAARVREALDSE